MGTTIVIETYRDIELIEDPHYHNNKPGYWLRCPVSFHRGYDVLADIFQSAAEFKLAVTVVKDPIDHLAIKAELSDLMRDVQALVDDGYRFDASADMLHRSDDVRLFRIPFWMCHWALGFGSGSGPYPGIVRLRYQRRQFRHRLKRAKIDMPSLRRVLPKTVAIGDEAVADFRVLA